VFRNAAVGADLNIDADTELKISRPARLGAFDGLRAVAVLLVVAGHTLDNLVPSGTIPEFVAAIMGNASFGVRLFFVLSGYLITALLLREQSTRGSISLVSFYTRRTLRIFPALYVYLIVMAVTVWLGWLSISSSQFFAAASYTWNYGPLWITDRTQEGGWFLGHLWTLSLEEQFYLFWPFVFVWLPRRYLNAVPWIFAACLPFVRIATYFLVPEWRGLLGMMFHTAIDSILIGCGFSLARTTIASQLQRLPMTTLWFMLAAIPLLISPLLRLRFGGAYSVTIGFTVDAFCVGALLVLIHEGRTPSIILSLLQLTIMQWLGRLSYSLYLWQQPFLTPLNSTWTSSIPWCFAAALGMACVSYYGVEQPVLRLKRRFERSQLTS